jgi:hypothetical protein
MGFRPVSISDEDYVFYDKIRKELIKEQLKSNGVRTKISLAEVIKTGVTYWNQRRQFVKDDKNNAK